MNTIKIVKLGIYDGCARISMPISWQEVLKDENYIKIKIEDFCFLVKNNEHGRLTIPKTYANYMNIKNTIDVLLELESATNATIKVHLLNDIQV